MKNQRPKTIALWALIILLAAVVIKNAQQNPKAEKELQYSEFVTAVESGYVKEVTLEQGSNILKGQFKPEYENGKLFTAHFAGSGDNTDKFLKESGVKYGIKIRQDQSLAMKFLS